MATLSFRLEDCLAYVILNDYEAWLGTAAPSCLDSFLSGAATRAELVGMPVPMWRLYGPLEEEKFYLPLVARTGHPNLTIKWATAMEIYHLSLADAMCELRELIRSWFERHNSEIKNERARGFGETRTGLAEHLRALARRPGMYLGRNSGWSLRCYLAGMDRGGDWLGLRPLAGLREIIEVIERRSQESYGSEFAAYRIYEDSPSQILAWVGMEPAGS